MNSRILNNPFLRRSLYTLGLSLALVCQGLSSHAVDILDNTGSATALSPTTIAISPTIWHSIIFTSHTNVTARSLTILLTTFNSTPLTGTVTVSLYGVNGSNVPTGSALATSIVTDVKVPNTAIKANANVLDLTTSSTGSWSMLANTNYALVIAPSLDFNFRIMPVNPSTANGTFITRRFTRDSGSSWGAPQPSVPYFKLSDTLTPVPEPSTYLLCGLATGVVALVSRNRKKKQA